MGGGHGRNMASTNSGSDAKMSYFCLQEKFITFDRLPDHCLTANKVWVCPGKVVLSNHPYAIFVYVFLGGYILMHILDVMTSKCWVKLKQLAIAFFWDLMQFTF